MHSTTTTTTKDNRLNNNNNNNELTNALWQLKSRIDTGISHELACKHFVRILVDADMLWHFDESIDDVEWNSNKPTNEQAELMTSIRDYLYSDYLFQVAIERRTD